MRRYLASSKSWIDDRIVEAGAEFETRSELGAAPHLHPTNETAKEATRRTLGRRLFAGWRPPHPEKG